MTHSVKKKETYKNVENSTKTLTKKLYQKWSLIKFDCILGQNEIPLFAEKTYAT